MGHSARLCVRWLVLPLFNYTQVGFFPRVVWLSGVMWLIFASLGSFTRHLAHSYVTWLIPASFGSFTRHSINSCVTRLIPASLGSQLHHSVLICMTQFTFCILITSFLLLLHHLPRHLARSDVFYVHFNTLTSRDVRWPRVVQSNVTQCILIVCFPLKLFASVWSSLSPLMCVCVCVCWCLASNYVTPGYPQAGLGGTLWCVLYL